MELEHVHAPQRSVAGFGGFCFVVGVGFVESELADVFDLAAGAGEEVDAAAVAEVVEEGAVGVAEFLVAVLAGAGVVEAAVGAELAVSHRLADVHMRIEAARLLAFRAANLVDEGEPAQTEAAAAKLASSLAFQDAADAGMQFFAGYGYMKEYRIERYWREARVTTVKAGTSEIQRSIIAKQPVRRPQPDRIGAALQQSRFVLPSARSGTLLLTA